MGFPLLFSVTVSVGPRWVKALPTYYYCQVQVVRVLAIANNGILPMPSLPGGGNATSTSFIHGVVQLYLVFCFIIKKFFCVMDMQTIGLCIGPIIIFII